MTTLWHGWDPERTNADVTSANVARTYVIRTYIVPAPAPWWRRMWRKLIGGAT